jgi:hypothetical protein
MHILIHIRALFCAGEWKTIFSIAGGHVQHCIEPLLNINKKEQQLARPITGPLLQI